MKRKCINMGGKFFTVDTVNFGNSIYVPQSNGVISSASNVDKETVSCWYADSRKRWTTLEARLDGVSKDDEIEFIFWAKYSKTPQTFMVEIAHRVYEERVTHMLGVTTPYCIGKCGEYKLFRVTHKATESDLLVIALSVNGCEMTVFPASAEDIIRFDNKSEKGLISKIHPVVSYMRGENYGFCGCMAYLADCLGLDFDFHYFAMATGDIFTQIHLDKQGDCTDCVSAYLFANDIVYKAFCGVGYEYELLDGNMIKNDTDFAMKKIKGSIDNDIPVISAGFGDGEESDFCVICGYTDDGRLKIMYKENSEPIICDGLLAHTRGLIFTGSCRHDINLLQQHSNVTRSIYGCINRRAERGCTFGKEAFGAWADSLVSGEITNAASVDSWSGFGYSLCIAGTNGYAGTPMLKDILKSCPEFEKSRAYPILKKVTEQFDIQNRIFGELVNEGFGFDIPEAKLRDAEFMRPAAEKIRELMSVCDNILAAYDGDILENDDFWCTDDYRIVKCYKEKFPKCRFVGKCYKNSDRVDGMYGYYWEKWHAENAFEPLERLLTNEFRAEFPECEGYVGLMKNRDGAGEDYFEYWIGMFLPEGCEVPDGYDYIDIAHEYAGICWIKGNENEVFCHEGECYNKLVESGMTVPSESDGGCYMFERYNCPRFTVPDKNNEVILDLGFFVLGDAKVGDISELKATGEGETDRLEYFSLPNARVIGKSMRCPLDMTKANPIPLFWDKCASEGLFETVGKLPKLIPAMLGFTDDYHSEDNTFMYVCGVLCPENTPVPEDYTYRDIPATTVSKSRRGDWLEQCKPVWESDGFKWSDEQGQFWNSELYLDGEDNNGFRLLCAVMKK